MLPLSVYLERKTKADKKCTINLNYYHTWHKHERNNIKKQYQSEVESQIKGATSSIIRLELVLFKGSKRKCDRSNVLCLHEKFACDALVKNGFIEDDNDNFIESTLYLTGGVDKDNPRVEMNIYKVS